MRIHGAVDGQLLLFEIRPQQRQEIGVRVDEKDTRNVGHESNPPALDFSNPFAQVSRLFNPLVISLPYLSPMLNLNDPVMSVLRAAEEIEKQSSHLDPMERDFIAEQLVAMITAATRILSTVATSAATNDRAA